MTNAVCGMGCEKHRQPLTRSCAKKVAPKNLISKWNRLKLFQLNFTEFSKLGSNLTFNESKNIQCFGEKSIFWKFIENSRKFSILIQEFLYKRTLSHLWTFRGATDFFASEKGPPLPIERTTHSESKSDHYYHQLFAGYGDQIFFLAIFWTKSELITSKEIISDW